MVDHRATAISMARDCCEFSILEAGHAFDVARFFPGGIEMPMPDAIDLGLADVVLYQANNLCMLDRGMPLVQAVFARNEHLPGVAPRVNEQLSVQSPQVETMFSLCESTCARMGSREVTKPLFETLAYMYASLAVDDLFSRCQKTSALHLRYPQVRLNEHNVVVTPNALEFSISQLFLIASRAGARVEQDFSSKYGLRSPGG